MRNGWHVEMLMVLAVVIWVAPARSYAAGEREGLPRMGPAPELSLTTQVKRPAPQSYVGKSWP